MKKFFAMLLTFVMLFSLTMPAMAADVNGDTTGNVTATFNPGEVEITGMEFYYEAPSYDVEVNYDEATNTYTVVIPAGTDANVNVGVQFIGKNLSLVEETSGVIFKEISSILGEYIESIYSMVEGGFVWDTSTRIDGYWATYQYSNDGGDTWSDVLKFEVKHGYSVTVNKSANGTVTADKTLVAPGDIVSLNVSPSEGYMLDKDNTTITDAAGNSVTLTENNTFEMPASAVAITPVFKEAPVYYNVTVNEYANGTVVFTPDKYTEGETVTLTVTPENGYKLSELTVKNGETSVDITPGEDNTYTFTMPAGDVTVTVAFEKITYAINIGTYEGGSVVASVNGETVTNAAEGDTVTLTVATTGIYQLKSIAVKDASNDTVEFATTGEASGIYTFVMPASEVTVEAVIEENRIVSAEIVWGSLAYIYTDESGWQNQSSADNAGTVTVTNTGNVPFNTKATYLAEADYMNIEGTFDNGATALEAGANQSFKLTLHNRPNRVLSGQKIGTVTVHISETEFPDYVTVTNETELLNALADGGSIKFGDSITLSGENTITSNVAIDLNGFTLNSFILEISGNATVNVSNGTVEGKLMNKGGELTVSDCTIINSVYAVQNNSGTTTLSNTTVNGQFYVFGGTVEVGADVTLNTSGALQTTGGTIICHFNPTDYLYSSDYVVTNNGDGTWTVTMN